MTFIPGCSSENTSSSSSLQDSHPKWPTTIIIITLLAKDQRCDRATVEVNINFAQQKICCYCGLVNKGAFNNYVDKKRGMGWHYKLHNGSLDKEQLECKMSISVHSKGFGDQIWSKMWSKYTVFLWAKHEQENC